MADIVERLRDCGLADNETYRACLEAADEITTLRTQLAGAREALETCETVIPWLVGQLEFAVRGVSVRDMTESLEMARTTVERARRILGGDHT